MDTAGRKYGGSLNIPDKLVVILSLARSIFKAFDESKVKQGVPEHGSSSNV